VSKPTGPGAFQLFVTVLLDCPCWWEFLSLCGIYSQYAADVDGLCFVIFRSRHALKDSSGIECSVPSRPQSAASWSAAAVHAAYRDASASAPASPPARAHARLLLTYTRSTVSSRTCWPLPATYVWGKISVFTINVCLNLVWHWSSANSACHVLVIMPLIKKNVASHVEDNSARS